jgi:hypothetical protein
MAGGENVRDIGRLSKGRIKFGKGLRKDEADSLLLTSITQSSTK